MTKGTETIVRVRLIIGVSGPPMETTVTKLEADVLSVDESLSVSDELPRICSLDSNAILSALQDLREDIRHNNNTLLNDKLDRIMESLSSLESRIAKLEQPAVSNLDSRKEETSKVEDRDIPEPS